MRVNAEKGENKETRSQGIKKSRNQEIKESRNQGEYRGCVAMVIFYGRF